MEDPYEGPALQQMLQDWWHLGMYVSLSTCLIFIIVIWYRTMFDVGNKGNNTTPSSPPTQKKSGSMQYSKTYGPNGLRTYSAEELMRDLRNQRKVVVATGSSQSVVESADSGGPPALLMSSQSGSMPMASVSSMPPAPPRNSAFNTALQHGVVHMPFFLPQSLSSPLPPQINTRHSEGLVQSSSSNQGSSTSQEGLNNFLESLFDFSAYEGDQGMSKSIYRHPC